MRAMLAIAALATVHAAPAHGCVEPQLEAGSIVYPEPGPRCPAIDAYERPSKEQQAGVDRQAAAADLNRRLAKQGNTVRRMSDDRCESMLLAVPQTAIAQDGLWAVGQPSRYNPYLTPQENWCMALGRSHESSAEIQFPGLLPNGWHAVPIGNGTWQINHN